MLLVSLLLLQVQEVQQYYAYTYTFTKAHAHIHALEALWFQPGAIVTGVMRTRLMHNMAKGTGTATPCTCKYTLLYSVLLAACRNLYQWLLLSTVNSLCHTCIQP
jgi:hypothetical protein